MYQEYYSLREEPFNLTPDPRFLYPTARHREALNHLLFGIHHRKGFICLTGEVGAGKTTICRALLRRLGEGFHTALVLNPVLSESQFLRVVVREFGIQAGLCDALDCMDLINEFLLRLDARGQTAVLIVDEVQDMPTKTLEMMRLLSNLETERRKLLQIVLVGQPELKQKLAKPALRQLAQRITIRFHLENMTCEETAGYIQHRLAVAGGAETIRFDGAAIREIHRHSGGTPRLVNALSDKALLAGYVHQTGTIGRKLIRLAARELKEAC